MKERKSSVAERKWKRKYAEKGMKAMKEKSMAKGVKMNQLVSAWNRKW